MAPRTSDELILKNTPNYPPTKRVCWNKRPCYRELECEYCWKRKRAFLLNQFYFYGYHWGFSRFVTISFIDLGFEPDVLLLFVANVRKHLHKKLFRGQKYISLIALHGSLTTPHFHLATTEAINKAKLKSIMKRVSRTFDENIKYSIHIKAVTDLYGLGYYLVCGNLMSTLPHRPFGLRLMVASRPFLTGKPKKLKHIQEWIQQNGKKRLYNR